MEMSYYTQFVHYKSIYYYLKITLVSVNWHHSHGNCQSSKKDQLKEVEKVSN